MDEIERYKSIDWEDDYEDEDEAAYEKYEVYAKLCDGEIVEITIDDDESYYGVVTIDRWKNTPEAIRNDEKLHHYDLRHDDCGRVCSITHHVLANHFGTLITFDELPIAEGDELNCDVNYIN